MIVLSPLSKGRFNDDEDKSDLFGQNVGTSESHKEILSDLDDENKECDRDFSNSRDQIYESSNFDMANCLKNITDEAKSSVIPKFDEL